MTPWEEEASKLRTACTETWPTAAMFYPQAAGGQYPVTGVNENPAMLNYNGAANSATDNNCSGCPGLVVMNESFYQRALGTANGYRWPNGAIFTSDVFLTVSWMAYDTQEAFVFGQIYDMIYIKDVQTFGTTGVFGTAGHTFFAFTGTAGSNNVLQRGQLWMVSGN